MRPSHRDRHAPPRRSAGGFTLIDFCLWILILASFGAVATLTYGSYARGSARVDAQALMTTAAARQAQFLVDFQRYAGSLTVLGLALPADLEGKYTMTIVSVDGAVPSFTLTATAIGKQANDKCPTLAIDQAGLRTPDGCWR